MICCGPQERDEGPVYYIYADCETMSIKVETLEGGSKTFGEARSDWKGTSIS